MPDAQLSPEVAAFLEKRPLPGIEYSQQSMVRSLSAALDEWLKHKPRKNVKERQTA